MYNDKIIALVYSSLSSSLIEDDVNVAAYLMNCFTWSKKGTLPRIKECLKRAIENNGAVTEYLNFNIGDRVCRRLNVDALKRTFYLFEKYERIKKYEIKTYGITI